MVSWYGPGASKAKFDVEAAYGNILIHPDDRFLLGMKWQEIFYVELALPFSLRSAPFIFNSAADIVEWILLNQHHASDYFSCPGAVASVCLQSEHWSSSLKKVGATPLPKQVCWF